MKTSFLILLLALSSTGVEAAAVDQDSNAKFTKSTVAAAKRVTGAKTEPTKPAGVTNSNQVSKSGTMTKIGQGIAKAAVKAGRFGGSTAGATR